MPRVGWGVAPPTRPDLSGYAAAGVTPGHRPEAAPGSPRLVGPCGPPISLAQPAGDYASPSTPGHWPVQLCPAGTSAQPYLSAHAAIGPCSALADAEASAIGCAEAHPRP
eukprot:6898226-Pyramimonas_sp.AAC.1